VLLAPEAHEFEPRSVTQGSPLGRAAYDTIAVGSAYTIKARVPRSQSALGVQSTFTFCEGLHASRGRVALRGGDNCQECQD
jgi:hypothetical protein